jgi:hypothetical protein
LLGTCDAGEDKRNEGKKNTPRPQNSHFSTPGGPLRRPLAQNLHAGNVRVYLKAKVKVCHGGEVAGGNARVLECEKGSLVRVRI